MRVRIDGGTLLEPILNKRYQASVLMDDQTGLILSVGTDLPEADYVIALNGELLLPGLVDLHVHLREPGFEAKETIATGAAAAAAGGFTQVACMPNTNPPLDSPQLLEWVVKASEDVGLTRVRPIACITMGQAGEVLTDFAALQAAGAVALSDDGKGVQHGGRMREAFERAAAVGLPIAIHAEDETISGAGVLHSSAARRLGLTDIPPEAESAMIARDILLAEQTGAHLHVCHVSVESAVSLVRWAKSRGVRISAEVTPHHLLLTEAVIDRDDAVFKVNPPLRTEADRLACIEGFLDGTLDVLATDHAPHTAAEKSQGVAAAPFGMVGLETAFALMYTHFVATGRMTLSDLVHRASTAPTSLFQLNGGVIVPGAPADLTVIDEKTERLVTPDEFASKGRNTPFAGWRLVGWPVLTVCAGKVVYQRQPTVGGNNA
ncbi:dihydroorotase [Alicyclobacillus sp. ALC3]|uniref:dihydroorotase n=1 Tax=Alicyclobacillus sp. ALC3 TaxID=2796143 RepID=UPI0023792940|nr:dihydroorotase [Alicyclobacillus sp. ALC3]WDL97426.1 dihydroorotase [Alicyclobacillus sp. ALC3]